jgi:hypothetical protein
MLATSITMASRCNQTLIQENEAHRFEKGGDKDKMKMSPLQLCKPDKPNSER